MARAIKEAIYIRVNNPTFNRNIASSHVGQSSVFHHRNKNKINDLSTITFVHQEVYQQLLTSAMKHLCLMRF